ncbi:hypothetical protein CRYUN_Cryun12cG0073400 [Craigia yunnanensis]
MSQVLSKSPKHCVKQGLSIDKSYKKLFFAFSAFFTTVLAFISSSGLFFTLQNLSSPSEKLISTNSISQALTFSTLPSNSPCSLKIQIKGHEESNLLTASLEGTELPVAPSFGYEVEHDQTAGRIVLNLKVNGKLRWKVGTWVSGDIASTLTVFLLWPLDLLPQQDERQVEIEVMEDEILTGKKKGCKKPVIDCFGVKESSNSMSTLHL